MDRLSAADVMQLITDVGPAPMQIGACLLLDAGPGFDAAAVRRCIADRVPAIPRLRQRPVRTPPGCGRPVWLDDPAFDVRHHIREQRCPAPGDDDALLGLAADVVTTPLPLSRPPWGAVLVTGLTGHTAALILVLHHVLADGIGGLAVLASLADEDPAGPVGPGERGRPGVPAAAPGSFPAPDSFPAPAPSRRSLVAGAWAGRLRAVRGLPGAISTVRRSAAELGVRSPARAARCSLNQPTGPHRRIAVAAAGLAGVRALAHAHGGTVNDVILAAAAGAVGRLLASRGETLPALVVSVPVSARTSASAGHLGNEAGVMPVALPTGGDLPGRLDRTAAITHARKAPVPGTSAVLLGAVFRLLAALGLFRWFINHQRLVHTFITNVRGPSRRLRLGGATISGVVPVTVTAGNVTVSFGVLSYAGTLTVTVVADPGRLPDLEVLTGALRQELAECGPGADPRSPGTHPKQVEGEMPI